MAEPSVQGERNDRQTHETVEHYDEVEEDPATEDEGNR